MVDMPASGGSYIRDPKTGALTLAPPASDPAPAPAPAAPAANSTDAPAPAPAAAT